MSDNADIAVVFSAETGGFVTNVQGMDQALASSAEQVAATKNAILQWGQESIRSAEKAGASTEQLASVQERVAARLASVTEANAQKIINSLDRQQQKARAVAEELTRVQTVVRVSGQSDIFASFGGASSGIADGAKAIHDVGEESERTASRVQMASANIRVLRGDMFQNTRAAEAFLSQFQALQGVFAVGFQVAGVIAIGAALFQLGEKAYKAWENIVNLKGAIEGLNATQITVDKRVGQLGDQSEQHVEDILSKTEGRSSGLRQKYAYQSNKGVDLGDYFGQDSVKKLPDDVKGNYESLYKSVAPADIPDRLSRITTEVKALNEALAFNKTGAFGESVTKVGDFGSDSTRDPVAYMQARLTLAKQIQSQLQASSTDRAAGLDAVTGDIGEAQKQEAEKRQRQSEEAARKSQEATRKAIEAQRSLWQEENDQIKIAGGQTAALEAWMWQARIDALKKGSAGYAQQLRYAQHELATAQSESQKQDAETAKRTDEQQAKKQSDQFDLDRDSFSTSGRRTPQQVADLDGIQMLASLPANVKAATDRWREAQAAADKYADEAQKASDKAALAAVQQKASYNLASLAIEVQTGQVSRLDAAQQTANIHAEQYRLTQDALRKTLSDAQAIDPAGANSVNAQAAIDKSYADRKIQIMQDAATTSAETWQGALKNANQQWIEDSRDSARQVVALYKQAVEGLNDNLADLMTGKKTNWSGYFSGMASSLAKTSLQRGESGIMGLFSHPNSDGSNGQAGGASSVLGKAGGLMGALGLGGSGTKPDGSSSNPFSVKVIGGVASGKGLGSLLGGSSDDDDSDDDDDDDDDSGTSKASGFLGKAGKFIASIFGGGRAVGGGVNPNTSYLVGEKGPELLSMGSMPGHITPNNMLGDGGGDTAHYTINVGAGISPEQTDMRVRAALSEYHKNVMPAGAVAAVRNGQQRSGTRRR